MTRWIIITKDHSTKMTNLVALPLKQAKFVGRELDQLIGFIGYPMIFHTDNGTEYTADQVVQKLKDINPFIQTVRGRVRKPSDQGSTVENMQKQAKAVLKRIEIEERQKGKDPNWTFRKQVDGYNCGFC